MKIEYLAHASFLIKDSRGTTIIFDPYDPCIGYGIINRTCDMLIISHEHFDHCHITAAHGKATVIRASSGTRVVNDIKIKGIITDHDKAGGTLRGKNIVSNIEIDGLWVCHLGDLGNILTHEQIEEIGKVDILFVPVGGHFIINADDALKVIDQLNPKLAIPMHYYTGQLNREKFPMDRVDVFIEKAKTTRKTQESAIEITPDTLPKNREILIMNYTY